MQSDAREAGRRDNWLKFRIYEVQCVQIPDADAQAKGAWAAGRTIGVVCRNAVEAIECVRTEYPDYRIDAVNQRGMVHHIVDSSAHTPLEKQQ